MLMHRIDSRGSAQTRRIIKQRPAELKASRICLHDVEMLEAGLLPSTPFRCVFDTETWTMVVLPSAEGKNHVSQTVRGSLTKPVWGPPIVG